MHHWHWLIVIYLFLGGLGAGAYLTSFAAEKGWLGNNSRLKRMGYYIAAPVVAVGTLLLVFDLGQGLYKPWLLFRLLFNLGSVMTWGVYILSAFIIIGLIKGFLVYKNKTAPGWLTWAGAVLALATGTYTGLLIAVVKAVPFWNTFIMPVLFVISALSTGLSVTTLAAHFLEKNGTENAVEGRLHLGLVIAEIIVVAIFLGTMAAGVNGPVGAESASMVMFGKYAIGFWLFFVIIGLLFPLAVFGREYLNAKKFEGQGKAEAEVAAHKESTNKFDLVLATDFAVLVGGFTLRALIIFAALPIWDGKLL